MDIILIIHFLKLKIHQVLFIIYGFEHPLAESTVAVKAFKILSSSESSSGLVSLKVAARALLFQIVLR